MESKSTGISRLKVPTKIGKPVKTPAVLKEVSTNKLNLPAPSKIAQTRRSKSFSDLRTISQTLIKPIKQLESGILKKLQTPHSKPVANANLKKKLNEQQKPQEDVKAKVPKPPKPAPYDFKARYNLLNDKYKALVQDFKDFNEQLVKTTEENDQHKTEIVEFKTKYEMLQRDHLKLEIQFKDLTDEYSSSRCIIEGLKGENLNLQETVSNLEKRVQSLLTDIEHLQYKHKELSTSYEALIAERSRLKAILLDSREKTLKLESLCENYKNELMNQEERNRFWLNMFHDLKGNVRVFCRIRPPLEDEEDRPIANFTLLDETCLELKKSKDSTSIYSGKPIDLKQEFTFDRVFPPESTQKDVFEDLSQLVQSALDGYNICVFAYGQTGSGKTFTMQGSENNLGLMPRTIDLLFKQMERMKFTGCTFKLQICFMEIYNEIITDLLDPYSSKSHEIHRNEGEGSTVTNLITECVNTPEELQNLISTAQKNRAAAFTDCNQRSSRSHAVTKIVIDGFQNGSNSVYQGSLNFVDLAGSEIVKNGSAERIEETKNINKSLSTLGNVMLALHNRDLQIPYRDSKLTDILESCLGGSSKTLMFVNICPFEDCYNETINSLRFAAKVKQVKANSKRIPLMPA